MRSEVQGTRERGTKGPRAHITELNPNVNERSGWLWELFSI